VIGRVTIGTAGLRLRNPLQICRSFSSLSFLHPRHIMFATLLTLSLALAHYTALRPDGQVEAVYLAPLVPK